MTDKIPCEHEVVECVDCKKAIRTEDYRSRFFNLGIERGRILMVSDLMNRHKTPFNIKIFPEEVTISSEKMLSLSNSLVDIYAENFARKLQKAYKDRLAHRVNCSDWRDGIRCIKCGFGLTQFLIDALGEDWELKMRDSE